MFMNHIYMRFTCDFHKIFLFDSSSYFLQSTVFDPIRTHNDMKSYQWVHQKVVCWLWAYYKAWKKWILLPLLCNTIFFIGNGSRHQNIIKITFSHNKRFVDVKRATTHFFIVYHRTICDDVDTEHEKILLKERRNEINSRKMTWNFFL